LKLAGSTQEEETNDTAGNSGASAIASSTAGEITIQSTGQEDERKNVSWLGVSTLEASEALASQLELPPGVGLLVIYVAPDSPAAKAGLRKNDVLTQFDSQSLVHPAQFRKLVRVRKAGTEIKLQFYHAGKQQDATVTLGSTRLGASSWQEGEHALQGNWEDLQNQFHELHLDDAVRTQMKALRQSLGSIKLDQKEVQEDIRRGMEEARQAVRDALRNATNSDSALAPLRKVLENLAHSGVVVDDKADVEVRSSGKSVRSVVKSDDNGTLVLLRNHGLYLTAHDKDGKLLFDGPVETAEQRAKVPSEVWERVEPLLEQIHSGGEQPETKESQ
jgi:hypothetical protein